MIEIKPSTAEDVALFFGRTLPRTIQAVSVWRDGQLDAIAGVAIEEGKIEAFSDIRKGISVPKITVYRVAKEIMKMIRTRKTQVFAIADPNIPTSERFLESLGFTLLLQDGKVYTL